MSVQRAFLVHALAACVAAGAVEANPKCQSWCNVYTKQLDLCSDCDCDQVVMLSDGHDKMSPHCSGAGGIFAEERPTAEEHVPPLERQDAAGPKAASPPPHSTTDPADKPCEAWCNKYSRDASACAGCNCDQVVMVSDGNDKSSEHCSLCGSMVFSRSR